MFSIFKRKRTFFTEAEQRLITNAIAAAERNTSGEVRVYIESRCSYMDALDRAVEIFAEMKMFNTAERNAVLVYVAVRDHQFAVYGDEGINKKVGPNWWNQEAFKMIRDFTRERYAEAIANCVNDIGQALKQHFPYVKEDKNELPDDIEFGR